MFIVLVILCNLLIGVSDLTRKLAVDHSGVQQVQVVSCLVGLISLPIYLYLSPPYRPGDAYGYAMALVTAVLVALGMLCFSQVLKGPVNAGVVSALCGLAPLVTVALACFIYDQPVSTAKWIAFVLALASMVLVNF